MSGWVKLHRRFLEWEWYTKNETKSVFLHILLKANFEDKKFQGVEVKRGQLITSIKTLSHELRLSEKQIRTAIKNLISTGELASKGANKWTMLTVCKYDSYQSEEETKGEQTDKPKANKGQTKGKQRATTKEEEESKELKEVKENNSNRIPELSEFVQYGIENSNADFKFSIEAKYEQWVENGWKDGNGKLIKNWKTKLKSTLPHLKPFNPNKDEPKRTTNFLPI